MREIAITIGVAVAAVGSARGEDAPDYGPPGFTAGILLCQQQQEGQARLACYDEVVRTHFPALAVGAQEPPAADEPGSAAPEELAGPTTSGRFGQWNVRIEDDPMDDETNVYVTVQSTDTAPNAIGMAEKGSLVLRCIDNTTAMIVVFPDYMGNDGQSVRYRLDDEPPKRQGWDPSTDGTALGHFSGRWAIPFIKELFGHTRLVVEAEPYSSVAIHLTFDISDVEAATKPIAAACHW